MNELELASLVDRVAKDQRGGLFVLHPDRISEREVKLAQAELERRGSTVTIARGQCTNLVTGPQTLQLRTDIKSEMRLIPLDQTTLKPL